MIRPAQTSRVGFSRILGLKASLALGLSVGFGLVLESGASVVMTIAGDGVLLALLLATLFYLPILLTFSEMAAGKPGSASAYQISRGYGYRGLTFVVGWLMLAGLVSAMALLSLGLATRLDVSVQSLLEVDIDHLWYVIAAVVLGAMSEWLINEDRWRARTLLVYLALVTFAVVLVWAALSHPLKQIELPRISFQGHDLTSVALLAAGLWFVDILLNHRRQMVRPDRTIRSSILGTWAITALLALVAASLVLRSPSLLMEFWPAKVSWGEARLEFLLLLVGVVFIWMGLTRIVARTVRLTGAMARQGYLPALGARRGRRIRALTALIILGTITVAIARWVALEKLVAVAAASFLLSTALVTFPHARRPVRELSANRRNRLPLHPLIPGMAIAVCLAMVILLPRIGQGVLTAWVLLGAVYYKVYASQRSRELQQDAVVIGEVDEVQTKEAPRILIASANQDQLTSLMALGTALARDMGAEIVVLRVLSTADELSLYSAQQTAEKRWLELDTQVDAIDSNGVSVSTLVRIAPSAHAGIIAAAHEYDVDLLIIGAEQRPPGAPPSDTLTGVFNSTSRPMVVFSGHLEDTIRDVVVGTAGGPHAPMALELGAGIAELTGGKVELVCVVPRGQPEEPAEAALAETLEKAALDKGISRRVVEADTVESGLIAATPNSSVLILGASVDRLLRRTVAGGLPQEVSRMRAGVTLVVKRAEAAMRFWQRRAWDFLARYTPTLSVSERSQVYSQMRHWSRADADFYAYISLSSAIAILGLLLNSAAVIIGAMLVAPLMSPILATAQGIVQGNLLLIQRAGATIFKGTSLSIGVATLITTIFPEQVPTEQILARTSPNLLDLGVALAAGGVGAWAVSRASGAAALPGVAIAVALVPPLCVVGYGLGTSRFWISGGAFLLFLTNLAAIVLVGALVFVLLGFRPTRVEREAQVRKAAVVTLLTVAILIIPLGLTTIEVSRQGRLEAAIKEEIRNSEDRSFRVWDFEIRRQGPGFLVEGTVYAFQGFETEGIFKLQEELQELVGVPVQVELTVVPATLTVAGDEPSGEIAEDDAVLRSNGE